MKRVDAWRGLKYTVLVLCALVTALWFAGCAPAKSSSTTTTSEAQATGPEVREGVVTFVDGTATTKQGDTWQPVAPGQRLPQGSVIKTGPDSILEIQFAFFGIVHLSPNTILSLDTIQITEQRKITSLELQAGSVTSKVAKLAGTDKYQIRTRVSNMGVRGTKFTVTLVTQESATVAVAEGSVALFPPGFDPVSLTSDQSGSGSMLAQSVADQVAEVSTKVVADTEVVISRSDTAKLDATIAALTSSLSGAAQVTNGQTPPEVAAALKAYQGAIAANQPDSKSLGDASRKIFQQTIDLKIPDVLPNPGADTQAAKTLAQPVAIEPKANESIDVNTVDAITFRWRAVQGAQSYKIEFWSKVKGEKKVVKKWTTEETSVSFDEFNTVDVGQFYWSVQALGKTRDEEGTVLQSTFTITKIGTLRTPKVKTLEAPKIK